MADLKKLIKDMFVFKEPEPREEFILEEKESEKLLMLRTHMMKLRKKEKRFVKKPFSKSANSEKKDSESGKESNNTENMTCVKQKS